MKKWSIRSRHRRQCGRWAGGAGGVLDYTGSVMRSVSDGWWVGVVEAVLLQGRLAAGGEGDVDSGA